MDGMHLIEQALQQYGLLGLIISFLVVGPGFTFLKAKNAQIQAEIKARELINEFARNEHQRADRLEEQLRAALEKLEHAESEVQRLGQQLDEARLELQMMGKFKEQIETLTGRIIELETLVEATQQENRRLRENQRQSVQENG